ncbi:MAG: heme ABC transporter substrate-binding protein IsdE [Eubacterium sp.]|nr:heme ABC transporter substrate-binding protein IsdE [Eubacterium sp.]
MRKTRTKLVAVVACVILSMSVAGCGAITDATSQTESEKSDPVELARQKVEEKNGQVNIISTSPSVTTICEKLNLKLVGVAESSLYEIPNMYSDVTTVGSAMSPDMEIIGSLSPDWILSPVSLKSDLEPKYEQLDTQWAFLNLESVDGMYQSISQLGYIFDHEQEADALVSEYEEFYTAYQKELKGKEHPSVLILMGLPGSYVIATENSYVGSLVQMAGGENVYAGTTEEFLNVNTEDMKTKEPDVILRAAHALPDQVTSMFEDEFEKNDIWQHFDAVKEGRVYDLSYDYFGMSANFSYTKALDELQTYLYDEAQ